VRDVQRLSRIASKGAVTIPADLAESVAKGDLTMAQALQKHKRVKRGPS